MKITLLPSSVSPPAQAPGYYLMSYVINDTLAVDAGSLGFFGLPQEQARVRHIFISHTHIDHVASLPIFVDNVYDPAREPVTVYGSEEVLASLRQDLFNGRLWPDFIALSRQQAPFLQLQPLVAGRPITLAGLRVTPVPVSHAVPTMGFIVDDGQAAVVIPSDTGPTEDIWERASALPHLQAVFLEAAFPNALASLAEIAGHLTPALFGLETRKVKRPALFLAVHVKPRFAATVTHELQALGLPNLEMAEYGKSYQF